MTLQQSNNHQDQCEVTLESVHYTSYRDHFMGQPVKGIRENLAHVDQQMIQEFMQRNYTAQNAVLSVCGQVDHAQVCEAAQALRLN